MLHHETKTILIIHLYKLVSIINYLNTKLEYESWHQHVNIQLGILTVSSKIEVIMIRFKYYLLNHSFNENMKHQETE